MCSDGNIVLRPFRDINVHDTFFDSLREGYEGFDSWFLRKQDELAYVMDGVSGVKAFLYLKIEEGPVTDIIPPLNTQICLKVGTFKIDAHGTKLGERFVKKIFDHAITSDIGHIYVTVFPTHRPLIAILERYGFYQYGKKESISGEEIVLVKNFQQLSPSLISNYPVVNASHSDCWLMSIYPKWHTKLFPDSILRTESASIVQDISPTNSIHKTYIGWMRQMERIKPNDVIIIYRSVGNSGRPWFESVATSICVVSENRQIGSFNSYNDFITYVAPHSVFSEAELMSFYETKKHGWVVSMTYNVALPKRLNMKQLVENIGLDRTEYWGFRPISSEQLALISQYSNIPNCALIG